MTSLRASINFTKDDIAHIIGSTGGVSDDARKGYPSPLPSDIAAVVLAKMESACNVTAGSIYANVAFIKKDKAYSLMDPVNPPSFYFDRYRSVPLRRNATSVPYSVTSLILLSNRVLYQKVRGENAMQYCTTVEFEGADDYVKCPTV